MDNLVSVRDSIPADAEMIFNLRHDERLRGMQYAPSPIETPLSLFALVLPGAELPKNGLKCSTILNDGEFAGQILQECTTGFRGVTRILLGWNLVPELWGKGIMVRALDLLFASRFKSKEDLEFAACCFASNQRCIRVIEKLGFQPDKLSLPERFHHYLRTGGRERVIKYRLNYRAWMAHINSNRSVRHQTVDEHANQACDMCDLRRSN